MTCEMYDKVKKELTSWKKEILVDIIIDKMSCAELEQFLKENG